MSDDWDDYDSGPYCEHWSDPTSCEQCKEIARKGKHEMKHVYIAHPLGKGPEREKNRLYASYWAAWAAEQGFVPVCSWIVISAVWDESDEHRTSGLAIDCEQISRCDELWICGSHVSPGMGVEIEFAKKCNVSVIDKREFLDPKEGRG